MNYRNTPVLCVLNAHPQTTMNYCMMPEHRRDSFNYHFAWLPRAVVDDANTSEITPSASVRQILPYCMVWRRTPEGVVELLSYQRAGGGESRLVKRSLGFGGHLELFDFVAKDDFSGMDYLRTMMVGMERELQEELKLINTGDYQFTAEWLGTYVSDQEEVGRLHQCELFAMEVPYDVEIATGEDCLIDPQWLTVDALTSQEEQYEEWSRMIIVSHPCLNGDGELTIAKYFTSLSSANRERVIELVFPVADFPENCPSPSTVVEKDRDGRHVVQWTDDRRVQRELCPSYAVYHGTKPSFAVINFQDGPIPTNGVNGCTIENLIQIAHHRLDALNNKMSSSYNDEALAHLTLAKSALDRRTDDRVARGVEGDSTKA